MKKKETTTENQYIAPPLGTIMKWWSSQKLEQDKGGSFNYELYLQYQNAITR